MRQNSSSVAWMCRPLAANPRTVTPSAANVLAPQIATLPALRADATSLSWFSNPVHNWGSLPTWQTLKFASHLYSCMRAAALIGARRGSRTKFSRSNGRVPFSMRELIRKKSNANSSPDAWRPGAKISHQNSVARVERSISVSCACRAPAYGIKGSGKYSRIAFSPTTIRVRCSEAVAPARWRYKRVAPVVVT